MFTETPSGTGVETAGPIKAKFYVEPPWVGGTIFCSRHLGILGDPGALHSLTYIHEFHVMDRTWVTEDASGSHEQDGRHAHIW